jgi:hypothetical protein
VAVLNVFFLGGGGNLFYGGRPSRSFVVGVSVVPFVLISRNFSYCEK